MTVFFNRTDPPTAKFVPIAEQPDSWRAEAFDRITGRKPNPNISSLDDALIDTVSSWKRRIGADLGSDVGNTAISSLFNSILFVRAVEDHQRHIHPNSSRLLLEVVGEMPDHAGILRRVLDHAFQRLALPAKTPLLESVRQSLGVFDPLDRETVLALFLDFYQKRNNPYEYDFSLISKHALSRIYENYVSVLRDRNSTQLTFYPNLPEETEDKSLGGVYMLQSHRSLLRSLSERELYAKSISCT